MTFPEAAFLKRWAGPTTVHWVVARVILLLVILLLAILAMVPAVGAEMLSVADFLRSAVKSSSREVYTYHYATRERAELPPEGYLAPDDPRLAAYLQHKFSRYWDLSLEPRPAAMVSGLYVATDPVASRTYGGAGDGWALVQLVLQPGFRWLDVRLWDDERAQQQKFSEELRQQLRDAGCNAATPSDLLTMLESQACHEIAVATVRELEVDGILYNFQRIAFEVCEERPVGALILLRPDRVDSGRLFLDESAADAATEDRLRIRDLFSRARQAGSFRKSPWPELEGAAPQTVMEPWIREHLFGCGDHVEDQISEFPSGSQATASHEAASPEEASQTASSSLGAAEGEEISLMARLENARALCEHGKLSQAVAIYEEILRHDPEFVEALYDLAWIRATQEELRDPEAAVQSAQALVVLTHYKQRRSTVGANWGISYKIKASQTLAVANAAAGNFPRAVDYGMQALQTAENYDRNDHCEASERLVEFSQELLAMFREKKPYRGGPRHDWPPGRPWE